MAREKKYYGMKVTPITNKPPEEWKRKGDRKRHYWQKWEDEDKAERKKEEEQNKPKPPKVRVHFSTADICHFLANRVVIGSKGYEEPVPYTNIIQLTRAFLHAVADILIEGGTVEMEDMFTIRHYVSTNQDNKRFLNCVLTKDFDKRLNQTGDKFLFKTDSIVETIDTERKELDEHNARVSDNMRNMRQRRANKTETTDEQEDTE